MSGTAQFSMEEYYEALRAIQAVEFYLIDLNLYLDTHPVDTQALNQYNQYVKQLKDLKQRFEEKFGPLTAESVTGAPFAWVSTPWPWEV